MLTNPQTKYQRFTVEPFSTRTWCNNQLTTAPRWCSSDLRDGNQALINPMDTDKKLYLFNHLVAIGFKEIEVAFPSASETDFNFVRQLIDDKLIPNDVWIQVITQSRPELIAKTFDALQGASKAIVHLYNATAPVFREVVFNQDKASTIELAVNGAKLVKQHCEQNPNTQWQFEYSPETFCFTEREFALEICEAVKDVWQPTADRPMIINLPATVEMNTPNVYADQIEWFMQNFSDLSHITISIHPHNDRGTGVACAELAMLAGATRVEGCLFGNGERTGNVDLVTLALNLYTQGIYPNLDFSNLQQTANVMTYCNELPIHPRHPYAGELVFTAFSGSHQDAIKKGFAKRQENPNSIWNVPYFTIDPKDIGATYEAVIRVNSQSGKSGAAWLLETHHGIKLPRAFQLDFSQRVKDFTHQHEKEASMAEIWQLFKNSYGLNLPQQTGYQVQGFTGKNNASDYHLMVEFSNPNELIIDGIGNGILSAFVNAINSHFDRRFSIEQYDEHSLGKASDSQAICYVVLKEDDKRFYGVAIGDDVAKTSMQAVLNAGIGAADRLQ